MLRVGDDTDALASVADAIAAGAVRVAERARFELDARAGLNWRAADKAVEPTIAEPIDRHWKQWGLHQPPHNLLQGCLGRQVTCPEVHPRAGHVRRLEKGDTGHVIVVCVRKEEIDPFRRIAGEHVAQIP
jgi:hypothetical protein